MRLTCDIGVIPQGKAGQCAAARGTISIVKKPTPKLKCNNNSNNNNNNNKSSASNHNNNNNTVNDPPNSYQLLICTAKYKSGLLLNLSRNIDKVFDRFTVEGKLTVRLKQPSHDILLSKGDPAALKQFSRAVTAVSRGAALATSVLSTTKPTKTKELQRPTSTMVITDRKDYPFAAPFPPSLTQLTVNNCRFTEVPQRILKLNLLTHLDLSSNVLGDIGVKTNVSAAKENVNEAQSGVFSIFNSTTTARTVPITNLVTANDPGRRASSTGTNSAKIRVFLDFSTMVNLRHLVLASNNLDNQSAGHRFWMSLPTGLATLDLSDNQLQSVSEVVCRRFPHLACLSLSRNQVRHLPSEIGRLKSLQRLSLARNCLDDLPCSLLWNKLTYLDVSGNVPYSLTHSTANNDSPCSRESVPLLSELTGKAVLDAQLPLSFIPFHLTAYLLSSYKACGLCRKACLPSARNTRTLNSYEIRRLAATLVVDGNQSTLPLTANLCSARCIDNFLRKRL